MQYLTTGNFALIISISLALLKFWEVIRDRLRIEAWHSSFYKDDRIYLANPTRNTILITHWNLVWIKKRFFITIHKNEVSTNYDTDDCLIRIEPCNYADISFNEEYGINWTPKEDNIDLCIELHIAGRKRSIRKTIHSFVKA